MRDWINLFENDSRCPPVVARAATGNWPAVLHGIEIAQMIVFIEALPFESPQEIMQNFDMWWEEEQGNENWTHLAGDNLVAHLKTVEIASIDLPEYGVADPEVAADYAKLNTKAPPILIVGNELHDGNHRVEAALARGETHITAYVVGN
jgi:hypothetical protein